MFASHHPNRPVVLVVDDDPDVLATMAHVLDVRGFQVLAAGDAAAAMAICGEQGAEIDFLVADLSLPGDRTGELARRVAAAYPHVKTVFATAIPRHIALTSGLVHPAAPYLEKPVSPDVLASLLNSMLPQHSHTGDSL